MGMSSIKIVFNEKETPSDEDLLKWINENGINNTTEFLVMRKDNRVFIQFGECARGYSEQCNSLFSDFQLSKIWVNAFDDSDHGAWLNLYLKDTFWKEMGMYITYHFWKIKQTPDQLIAFLETLGFSKEYYNAFYLDFEKDMSVLIDKRKFYNMGNPIIRKKHWAETLIEKLLNKNNISSGEHWKYVEMYNENGDTKEQAKLYPAPDYWASYPDFEKYTCDNFRVVMVEVKGYVDYFANRPDMLAIKQFQYNGYCKVQKNEKIEVRVVFVIYDEIFMTYKYYWEKLDEIKKMQKWYGAYNGVDHIFWNCNSFRTDIENLGEIFA
jgi:hypothetical protein